MILSGLDVTRNVDYCTESANSFSYRTVNTFILGYDTNLLMF